MTEQEAVDILEEVKYNDDSMYAYNDAYCEALDMAIEALKAQEPKVMTLEEWREWKRKPLSQRDPVYYVDNKGVGSWIAPNDQLFIYATPELGYGILFVCLTSRPTDEQREMIPWESMK